MEFMGISFWELLFILLIALMVFGPGKLPEIARMLGQGMRKFKMATTELTREITAEMNKEVKEVKDDIRDTGEGVSTEVKDLSEGIEGEVNLDPDRSSESVEEQKKKSMDTAGYREDEIEM